MKKAVVIFSGFNQRAVVTFLRTLGESRITYAIIASSQVDPIFLTKYNERVLAVRNKKELDLDDIFAAISKIKQNVPADSYIIAPSTEALNRFLLQHREQFEQNHCEIPLVSERMYETVSDKYKFGQMCQKQNILVPKEFQSLVAAPLPFVAKPKTYFSKSSGNTLVPVLMCNEKEREQFLKSYNSEDFYFQKYITGRSLYLLYYFYKDGAVAKLSQENFIQQPEGKSMIAAETTILHTTKESAKYEKLFQEAGFFGLVMVEVKEDKGQYYMIEANPRFWGPSQLFVDAKVDFFQDFLFDYGLVADKPEYSQQVQKTKYFWYGGLVTSLNKFGYVDYHNYTDVQFEQERSDWLTADVYNREDTKEIFKSETGV